MHTRHLSRLLAGICLSLFNAITVAQSSNSPTNRESERFDTRSLYDAPTKQNVFFVPSSGFIADRTFMAQSLMSGPSKLANELASWMTIAAQCPLQLTVTGKNETKTLRVIKDAFDLVGNRDWRTLDFTFVGSSNAAVRVEKWVRAVGGTFHSRPKLDE